MKVINYLLVFILILSLVGLSSAQNTTIDCQYKEKQDTGKTISYLQDKEGNNYTNPVEFRDFTSQGRCPAIGCIGGSPCSCKVSFIARNNINSRVSLKVQYSVIHNRIAGYSIGSTNLHQEEKEITLNSLEDYLIANEYSDYCDDQECSINADSIRFVFSSNEEITSKIDKVYEDVCKKCNEKICLDDESQCNNDLQCGSGICNIAGFCGVQKIVLCPKNTKNCNNQSCSSIGVKKVGDVYSCEFECKTGYGESGICQVSTKERIFKVSFIIFFIILSVLTIYLIWSN